jgi:hypothetical protein
MLDRETDAAKAARAARAIITTLEAEGFTEPRLLAAIQFLALAVERLATIQEQSSAPSTPD